MCFYLDYENQKIKILKEDKIVYKIITKDNCSIIYNDFKWEENKRYELGNSLEIKEIDNFNEIDEGFHSFTTYKTALLYKQIYHKIIKLTIPKGAEYIENRYGECVSNIVKTNSLENLHDNPKYRK